MLRVHFTNEDLVRTRVAETPDPLWETVLSLQMLRARYGLAVFGDWRRRVREDLRRAGLSGVVRELLFPLTPDDSYFPDFLTPAEGLLGVEAGIEALLATPRRRLRGEVERLEFPGGVPPEVRAIADGDREALGELGRAMRAYHDTVLEPQWGKIMERVAVDHGARAVDRRTGGIDRMLSGFWPVMRWRPPVLEIPKKIDRDVHLAGRGLLLVPSHFLWSRPVPIADPTLPPTIIYPMRLRTAFAGTVDGSGTSLTRLLGPSRAEVLRGAADGRTTSELARRAGISAASASGHAGVLREAGLISSQRNANTMVHVLTGLGAALLREERQALI